jgi:hypothetical protein
VHGFKPLTRHRCIADIARDSWQVARRGVLKIDGHETEGSDDMQSLRQFAG